MKNAKPQSDLALKTIGPVLEALRQLSSEELVEAHYGPSTNK